jgi:hypothetical protein
MSLHYKLILLNKICLLLFNIALFATPWFYCPFGHVLEGDLGSDFFLVLGEKIHLDRIDFMSIGVVYTCAAKYSWRILLICLYSLKGH